MAEPRIEQFQTSNDKQDSDHAILVLGLIPLMMKTAVYKSMVELEDEFSDHLQ